MTRKIRARYDAETITVYQAYDDSIADAALRHGTFVSPFKMDRMTWIKPSFMWMMYRSGFATKPGQSRVLAVDISREGFEWALEHSCASSFDPSRYETEQEWRAQLANRPVRVQWDPERDLALQPTRQRSIQIGLSGEAVRRYVNEWIVRITDRTELAHEMHRESSRKHFALMRDSLPEEHEYPLPERSRAVTGAD